MSKTANRSRRRFLTLIGGAGVAAVSGPAVLPSSALGKDENVAPSNRITVGCIGVGNQGHAVMRNFLAQDDARVLAVCDAKTCCLALAKRRADRHYADRSCTTYADWRDLVARDDIDAVLIATPDHWHVLIALAAAGAGKDIYLEKPVGLSLAEDRALQAAVHRRGTVFQFGTHQRSGSRFRRTVELVRNGRLGRLHTIRVWSPGSRPGGSTRVVPVPEYLDYEMWLGPAPFVPHTEHRCANSIVPGEPYKVWPFIADYCLGWIAGWGIHPLDIALWGAGPDLGPPREVEGTGTFPSEGVCNTATHWRVTVTCGGGITIDFRAHPAPDEWRRRYGKIRDHGTAFEGAEGWALVDRAGMNAHPKRVLSAAAEPGETRLQESPGHVRNFLDCVKSRAETICPIDAAVEADTLCQLSAIAARLGRKLRWDATAGRFAEDDAANRMLTRAMRSPWRL